MLGDAPAMRDALNERFAVLDAVLSGRLPSIVYPAAAMGRRAARSLAEIGVQVVGFGDTSLHGTVVDGLPVFSPDKIAQEHSQTPILVASTMHDSAICENLSGRGCQTVLPVGYLNLRLPDVFKSREYEGARDAATDPGNRQAVENAFSLLADDESRRVFLAKLGYYLDFDKARLDAIRSTEPAYFDASVYSLGDAEIVVDGGAYVGDTLRSFLDACADRFRAYYAFEPDESNYAALSAIAATDPERIVAECAGLSRHTSSGRLLSTAGADSRVLPVGETGGESISLVSLDDYFEGRSEPTLIKMDIEGFERDALLGAEQVITRASPLLAVSAYHFASDLWTIPLLMNQLVPGGRLYLRHYSREIDDTVCYAVPER